MRIPRFLYVAVSLLFVSLVVVGCAFKPAPKGRISDLLDKANTAAVAAQRTKGDKKQIEAFQHAVQAYADVTRKDADSPEAAQAQLASAKLMAGVPIDYEPGPEFKQVYRNKKTKYAYWVYPVETTWQEQNFYTSRDTLRQIVQRFGGKDKLFSDLEIDYGKDGAKTIQTAVKQAEILQHQVGEQMDIASRGGLLYRVLDSLVKLTGSIPWFSYWFAIILITIIIKILITPLTKAQFKGMREMQRIQPLVKELQEKYKDDRKVLGEKMMELYKEHGVNPLAGCLPLLIQMPILITLYYTIRSYEFQFQNGSFLWIGWDKLVHKFSVAPSGRPIWFTAENLSQPDLLLLLLYIVSMYISQRISVVDPAQAEQQKIMSIMMPVMFFFIIGYLPSAFVLYWFVFNLLQTWQQYNVVHKGLREAELQKEGEQPADAAPAPRKPNPSRRKRRK